MSVFFFQAEDGIRDLTVTGVQTCALPISAGAWKVGDGLDPSTMVGPLVSTTQLERVTKYLEIGRASCRERVKISLVVVALKEKRSVVKEKSKEKEGNQL